MEEEFVDVDVDTLDTNHHDDDDDESTTNFSYIIRRRQNQCKEFSHYKPSDQYKKTKTQISRTRGQEYTMLNEDSIRKEVVGDAFLKKYSRVRD